MKNLYFLCILLGMLFSMVPIASASIQVDSDRAGMLADYDYFFAQYESIHPEPYKVFGDTATFVHRRDSLRTALEQRPTLTARDMALEVSRMLLPLHDGHTYFRLETGQSDQVMQILPMGLRCIQRDLVVNGCLDSSLQNAQLLSINGLSLSEILQRISILQMTENEYGLLDCAREAIVVRSFWNQILEDEQIEQSTVVLKKKDGKDTTVVMPFMTVDEIRQHPISMAHCGNRFPHKNLTYSFADSTFQSMVYCMNSVMALDCMQFMKRSGWEWESSLNWCWNSFFDTPMPEDKETALNMLPSLSITFANMLQEMKEHHSQTLILDLRDNGGGFTPMVYAILYMMYGDQFLKTDMQTTFATRISEGYLQKNHMDIEQMSQQRGIQLHIDDFVYEEVSGLDSLTDEKRQNIVGSYMSSIPDFLQSLNGKPIYTPAQVYVVTNAATFSAAFHTALMFSRMGATLVGIPSGQAPNTYMEITDGYLPNTGIHYSVSNSKQTCFPDEDYRAHVLWPDWMPTYADYAQFDFDIDAELLYILSRIEK